MDSFFKLFNEYIIKFCKKFWYKWRGEAFKLTQLEANKLCEGDEPDIPDILATYMNMFMTALFYAPVIPATIPYALTGGIVH